MIAKAISDKARRVQKLIDMSYPHISSKEAENIINTFTRYQAIWLISEVNKCPSSVTNLKKMIM